MDEVGAKPRRERGCFIVIEGIDGSGSTTQGGELVSWFQQREKRAFLTNEPSNGPAGMLIRLALAKRLQGAVYDTHDPDERPSAASTALDPHTLALLFAADRRDHLHTQITPNLDRGRHVVCDRYLLSTLAYQGQSLGVEWLLTLNEGVLRPDLTFFLDLPADEALRRMRKARWARDIYEDETQQRSIRQTFLDLIGRRIPAVGPVVVVDAARPREEVTAEMTRILDAYLRTGQVDGVHRPASAD